MASDAISRQTVLEFNKIVGHPAGMADDLLVYGKKKTPHTFGDVSEKCSV